MPLRRTRQKVVPKPKEEKIQPAHFVLNNDITMPSIGISLNRLLSEGATRNIIDNSLKQGYRLFDTSWNYRNEYHIHTALKELLPKHNLSRSDVFITTKLAPADFESSERTEKGFMKSLNNLGFPYIDLFLVENPGLNRIELNDKSNNKMMESTWSKIIEMYYNGKVNAIGVANFNVPMLENLLKCSHAVTPVVNRLTYNPHHSDSELYKFCKENEILIQSPLNGDCLKVQHLLGDPLILKIARAIKVSTEDLVIGWLLNQEIAVLSSPIKVNSDNVHDIPKNFTIPEHHLNALNELTATHATG